MSPALTPQEITDFTKSEARLLGFTLVGVTTTDPPPHLDVYQAWIQAGKHGEMGYLATDRAVTRRAEPRKILPECRSILVAACNYLPSRKHAGGVAAYAVGEDYHEVLIVRLQELLRRIELYLGEEIPNRIYTDSGPLLERELAQRAGLGWIGKNTCLIHPEHGSYFFLAEVLLGLELVPDQPFQADHCGSCMLCVEACPTQCILPNRTIDARSCISYITIELSGSIPEQLRIEIGDWVFGCDICQQVCPWNLRFAKPTADSAFQYRPFLRAPTAEEFLELTPERYRNELRDSPLKRARREGLLRNAAVAAGNRGDPAAVPALENILRHEPHPVPRAHAAWALGQLGKIETLEDSRVSEQNPEVLLEIEAALEVAAGRSG